MYDADLAFIHDRGFVEFSTQAAPEIARILRRAGVRSGRIVEIGCGSGRLAGYLTERGYRVRGFDLSPAMVRLARAHAPRASFDVASLADARIPRCDAAIAVGEVVTYVPGGLPVLSRFFERVHRALRPGGVLLFDFLESARDRTYATKTKTGAGWRIAMRADYDPEARVLTRRMSMVRQVGGRTRRSRETHRIRIYSRREIRAALEHAGFDVTMGVRFGEYRLLKSDVAVIAIKRPLG